VVGATSACEEFLTGSAKGTLDEQTLANAGGVEGSLVAAYRMLDRNTGVGGLWGGAGSNWVWGSVPSDDAYKGSEATDQPLIDEIEFYTWGTGGAGDYLNDKWRSMYEGVVRSNATISLLSQVREASPSEISDSDADGIRGEALFLRAHYHFEAWRMWGNIPYYTETDEDFRKPGLAADAVPANLLSDLDAAIGLLEATPRNGEIARATSWTARAYKGMVQIYAGDYAGALTTLREVRQSGPYALEQDFTQVWTGRSEFANGPETILAFQASVNDGEPDGSNGNWGERLNFPHGGSPFGCCGFHQPSQNLVNYFRVDGNGLPLASSDPNWNANDAEFDAAASDPANNVPVDPRLDWTVGRDGVPYKDWNEVHAADWIRAPGYGGLYSPKRHVHEAVATDAVSNVGWNSQHINSVNIHIYRYADLLLLLAEAEVEAGSLEEARTIVNEIRARAGVVAQGPGTDISTMAVPIDDPSITWADYEIGLYTTAWTDQVVAREAVRAERRLELAMEGQRFFDLRRWGIMEQVLNDYVAVEQGRLPKLIGAVTVEPKHMLYPIPPIQIELSQTTEGGGLTQNPNW
jgi:hypothetical protein